MRVNVPLTSGRCQRILDIMIDRRSGPLGTTEIADAGNALTEAEMAVVSARQSLTAAVRRARQDGVSWQAIADMLGVSRQAAHQRFFHVEGS